MKRFLPWISAMAVAAVLTVGTGTASAQIVIQPSVFVPAPVFVPSPIYGPGFAPGVYNPYSGRFVNNYYRFGTPFGGFSAGEQGYNPYTGNFYSYQKYGNPLLGRYGVSKSYYNPTFNTYSFYRYGR
ncbi:hypothetical protein [Tuwongella immobilis]|uniref:Uncharacterized protein n=1 Tax=Tuwongella immobilis TaxID=692036 RepID=A0A6C2YLF4_9BACT|nr:hypothetical protein [Tuwongella immobilis]VIP02069.1 unnamed protein product [Tuwongella immobilis]VTS00294.1 unnamed protein product [Tuwongella immobilis]